MLFHIILVALLCANWSSDSPSATQTSTTPLPFLGREKERATKVRMVAQIVRRKVTRLRLRLPIARSWEGGRVFSCSDLHSQLMMSWVRSSHLGSTYKTYNKHVECSSVYSNHLVLFGSKYRAMKTSTAAWAILNPLEWRVWVDQNGSSCQNLDCRTNNQPQPSKCSWWVLTDRLTEYVFVIQSINWHKWRSVFFCMPQLAATDDRDYYRMKDRYSSSGSSNSIKDSWRVQFDVECFFGLEVHQGWNLFGSHAWPGLHQHSQSVSVLSLGNLCHSEQWHPLWPWWTQTPPEDLHWANRRSHQKRRKGCNVRLIQKTKSNVCWVFWEIEVHDLGWFRVAVTLFVPPNEPPVQCWPWLRHEHFYWLRNAQVWQWDTQQGEASLGKMWSSISSVETKHMLYCVSLAH